MPIIVQARYLRVPNNHNAHPHLLAHHSVGEADRSVVDHLLIWELQASHALGAGPWRLELGCEQSRGVGVRASLSVDRIAEIDDGTHLRIYIKHT